MYKKIFSYEPPGEENVFIEIFENEVLKLFMGRIMEVNSERIFVLEQATDNNDVNLLSRLIDSFYGGIRAKEA